MMFYIGCVSVLTINTHRRLRYKLLAVKLTIWYEPDQKQTNIMTFKPSEDSDQPGHPLSQIRIFAVRLKTVWVLSYP